MTNRGDVSNRGPACASPEDEVRSRILDAADACISRYGVQKTTVDDVAKKAGVARATLYKHVPGGRDELVLAVLMREAERSVDTVLDAMQRADTLEDSLTDGIIASVDRIRSDDHLAYLYSPDILGNASRLSGAGEALVLATADILRPFLDAARDHNIIDPDLGDRDVADWGLRIIASLVWFEGLRRDRDELIDFVRRFFVRPLLNAPDPVAGASE
jgi:AcrR family transcriptional regulator